MARRTSEDAQRPRPTEQEKAEKFRELLQEEIGKPMRYVKHDADAHRDPKLEDLRDLHGFDALGRWWLLVELLASRQFHRYETDRPNGWARLAHDLEFFGDDAEERCREFVGWLLELRLLHAESFEDCGYVRSERIERNAYEMAEVSAYGRVGAWAKEYGNGKGA